MIAKLKNEVVKSKFRKCILLKQLFFYDFPSNYYTYVMTVYLFSKVRGEGGKLLMLTWTPNLALCKNCYLFSPNSCIYVAINLFFHLHSCNYSLGNWFLLAWLSKKFFTSKETICPNPSIPDSIVYLFIGILQEK